MAALKNTNRAILTPEQVLAIQSAVQGRRWLEKKRAELRAKVNEINAALAEVSNPALAKKHKVSRWTIASIACGKNWSNL